MSRTWIALACSMSLAATAPLGLVAGCGGAQHGAPSTHSLELGAMSVQLPDGTPLVFAVDGRVTENGRPLGRITTDGRFLDGTGAELASLDANGAFVYRGGGGSYVVADSQAVMADAPIWYSVEQNEGMLLVHAADDNVSRAVVQGIRDSLHDTLLFGVLVYYAGLAPGPTVVE